MDREIYLREICVRLTPRERQVFECILDGLSNKEIADKIGISVRTVKFHVSNLYVKFNVPGRIKLVAKCVTFTLKGELNEALATSQ